MCKLERSMLLPCASCVTSGRGCPIAAFPSSCRAKHLVARALSANEISPDTSLVRDVSSDIEWARVNFFDEHTLPTAEVTTRH